MCQLPYPFEFADILVILDQLFGGSNDVKLLRDNMKQFVRELSGPNGLGFDSVRVAFATVDPSSSGASHTVTVYSSLSSNIDAVRLREIDLSLSNKCS